MNLFKFKASPAQAIPAQPGEEPVPSRPLFGKRRHHHAAHRPDLAVIAGNADLRAATPVHPNFLRTLFEGRAFSGRAELRHHNALLKAVILLLIVLMAYQNYLWFGHSNKLADQQWLVFHDLGGTTTAGNPSEYRTGPSDEEIKHQAWECVRWVLGAGSANVDTAYAEASKIMTKEMRTEFEAALGGRRAQLKDLRIYRVLENVHVIPLTDDMLPPGSRLRPTRYDLLVSGTVNTYREGTQEVLMTGPFSYHLREVPLDKRSVDNPYGLAIAEMDDFDLPTPPPAADRSSSPDGVKTKGSQTSQ